MVTAIYIAINESVPKLSVQKIGSSGTENKGLLKNLSVYLQSYLSKSIY